MKTIKELQKQIEKSKVIIQIETLILEATQKELKHFTTKEKRQDLNTSNIFPENSITRQYLQAVKEGNAEAIKHFIL